MLHRRWFMLATVILAISGLSTSGSFAATLSVQKDGSGDFSNIADAAAAAAPGDEIAVGPGTYVVPSEIHIQVSLRIYSTHGPTMTLLTGLDQARIFLLRFADFEVSGFTIVDGGVGSFGNFGGGITIAAGTLLLENCVFRGHSREGGSAVYVTDSNLGLGTTLTARDCVFEDNHATDSGGAVYVVLGARADFERCTFRRNRADVFGGAAQAHLAEMNFVDCLFQENTSGDVAGGLLFGTGASGSVTNCTFVGHTSPGIIAGTIVAGMGVQISNTIIVGETHGYGIRWYLSPGQHSCNVFWQNASGAMDTPLAETDVVSDPLFCGPQDFHISGDSPAAPGGIGCGLIGAFGVACGSVRTVTTTWGGLKAKY